MNAVLPSNFGIQQRGKLPIRLISKEGTAAENSQTAGVSRKTLYPWRDEFLTSEFDNSTLMVKSRRLQIWWAGRKEFEP